MGFGNVFVVMFISRVYRSRSSLRIAEGRIPVSWTLRAGTWERTWGRSLIRWGLGDFAGQGEKFTHKKLSIGGITPDSAAFAQMRVLESYLDYLPTNNCLNEWVLSHFCIYAILPQSLDVTILSEPMRKTVPMPTTNSCFDIFSTFARALFQPGLHGLTKMIWTRARVGLAVW